MTQNPWTRQQSPTPGPQQPGPSPQPADVTPRGPSAPQHGVPAPAEDQRLPKFAIPVADTLWWVGVHGGAGETTMSLLLPGTRAANHRWPIPPPPVPTPVILVARTHGSGLRAAQRAAIEWASGVVQGVPRLRTPRTRSSKFLNPSTHFARQTQRITPPRTERQTPR